MKISKNSQGVYYWTDYINGKRIKRESKKWKYKYQAQQDYDEFIATKQPTSDLSFEQLKELYLDYSSLKNKLTTVSKLRYDLDRYATDFYKVKVKKIKPHDLVQWQKNLMKAKSKKGQLLGNSYLSNLQSTVKRIFRFGLEQGLINHNPALNMIIAKRNEPKIIEQYRILTTEEFEKFEKAIDNIQYRALFNVLYWCGLRMGEAIALNIGDYQDTRLIISKSYDYYHQTMTTTKTNQNRLVDVPLKCQVVLKELLDSYQGLDYDERSSLFGLYKRLSPTSIRRRRDAALETSGVHFFKIHELRHSHVSTLIELGFSAFEISKRLGHSVEMVNNTYGHLFPSKQKAMIDKLNEL